MTTAAPESSRDFLYTADERSLGILRVAVFSIALLHVIFRFPAGLSLLPRSVFDPPGPLRLLPESAWNWILTEPFLLILHGTLCVLLFCILLGRPLSRALTITTVLLLWFFDAILKGHGAFINHAQFGFLFIATLLAVSPPSTHFSLGRPRGTAATPQTARAILLTCATVFTLVYALLGSRRLSAGLHIYADDTLPLHIARQSLAPSEFGIDVMFHALQLPHVIPILQLVFFIITLLEALAPLILILPRFRILWVWVMIPFHLSTLIAMNILFWENALLVLLLFTPLIYPRNR